MIIKEKDAKFIIDTKSPRNKSFIAISLENIVSIAKKDLPSIIGRPEEILYRIDLDYIGGSTYIEYFNEKDQRDNDFDYLLDKFLEA